MVSIPTLAAFAAGEQPTGAKLTAQTKTAIEATVYFKPFCYITQTVAQSIPNSAETQVQFDTSVEDTDTMADLANDRIVIQTSGIYRLTYQVQYSANGTGERYASLYAGAIASPSPIGFVSGPTSLAGFGHGILAAGTVRLTAGQVVLGKTLQSSGGALNTSVASFVSFLQAEWISQ